MDLRNRDIFIPLGYGNDDLAERVKKESYFEGAKVHCLLEALPYNDYKEMLGNCTHAIFGMIRQSGLGNIHLCFKLGIKVFLFEDSILYKYFKNKGYYVYTIEKELNEISICEPLSPERALHNNKTFYSNFGDTLGLYDEQFDSILSNLQ